MLSSDGVASFFANHPLVFHVAFVTKNHPFHVLQAKLIFHISEKSIKLVTKTKGGWVYSIGPFYTWICRFSRYSVESISKLLLTRHCSLYDSLLEIGFIFFKSFESGTPFNGSGSIVGYLISGFHQLKKLNLGKKSIFHVFNYIK